MPDFETVREIKARVQGRLFGFSGVHAVGVGHKIVNGRRTDDVSIMVFVVRKKPLTELKSEDVIPPEIEGIKTDVYESSVARRYSDTAKYRPLIAGTQIEPGGQFKGFGGTLGFFVRSQDSVPKIYGVTCYHVVGTPEGNPTDLQINETDTDFTFVGENTAGTLVLVGATVTPAGGTNSPLFDTFYVTAETDTLTTIASKVAGKINATAIPNLTASSAGATVTWHPSGGATFRYNAYKYGPHAIDRSARLQAFVNGNQINMAGIAVAPGGAYVNINVGGLQPTFGVFAPLGANAIPRDNAKAIIDAIQNSSFPNVTASPNGTFVNITGNPNIPQEIECDVTTDVRVGQPTACFCSRCSACCDRRIGHVAAGRLDLDAALIELDPGLQYKVKIAGVDGPITGKQTVTMTGVDVRMRGSVSLLKEGTILALDKDGNSIDEDQNHDPPKWQLFGAHYTGAIAILPADFSAPGDSGAALLSKNSNDIMGLVFGGTDKYSLALPIDPILTTFKVLLETATVADADLVRTVPAPAGHAFMALDGNPVFANGSEEKLREAYSAIVATQVGAELVSAARQHADEAQQLVNSNKRVATVWHRNHGPLIVQAALDSLQSPDCPRPREIEGKPVKACLQAIHKVFMRYASSAFAEDLRRMGMQIIELWELSYSQLLLSLKGTATPE